MIARVKLRQQSKPERDLDEARRFLNALAPGEREFAFQTFDDNPDRTAVNKQLACDYNGTFDAAEKSLIRLNGRNAGVFVAINETNGRGRKKENVVAVRALMLDLDERKPLEPERFLRLLEEIWPEDKDGDWDKEAEATLLEMMGYLLTPDTRQQKIFLIVGPKRGGKGTIVFLIEQLLGKDNVVFQTLDSLTGEFGRWPLIDKKLAVFADARLGSRGNIHRLVETLLSISGGDPQSINRKYGSFWNGRLLVRFLITTNVLPALRDASGTIASRFIMLRLTETFFGREDLDLKAKLEPELPGILNLALKGLDRLRKRGYFRQPASSAEAIKLLEDIAAPVGAFLRDWGEVRPEAHINVKEMFRAYRDWCSEAEQKPLASNMFGKELRDAVPSMGKPRGAGGARTYVGVGLSVAGREAWDELLEEKGAARRRW